MSLVKLGSLEYTCSATEFEWTEIIQTVAQQYGQKLTDEQVNAVQRKVIRKENLLLWQDQLIIYSSNYGVKLF